MNTRRPRKKLIELMRRGGFKADTGKPRFSLLDRDFMWALALVMTAGAASHNEKPGERNYTKLENWRNRLFDSLQRHAWRWFDGELKDEEGAHHLASVAANAMMLFVCEKVCK